MSIEFDFSQLSALSVEIDGGNEKLPRLVEKAVAVSALKGRRAWQASARSSSRVHLPGYPVAVDYDKVSNDGGLIGTDLGPSIGKAQGSLGIVEDSPGGVRGAPQRNYVKAEKVIEKDLVVGVLKAVDDSLGGV